MAKSTCTLTQHYNESIPNNLFTYLLLLLFPSRRLLPSNRYNTQDTTTPLFTYRGTEIDAYFNDAFISYDFGYVVVISGKWLLSTDAYAHLTTAPDRNGQAYLFELDYDSPSNPTITASGLGAANDVLGYSASMLVSTSNDGISGIVVGAPASAFRNTIGYVNVYTSQGTSPSFGGTFSQLVGENVGDNFGYSVATSFEKGQKSFILAVGADVLGKVYVYRCTIDGCPSTPIATASGIGLSYFGYSVAVQAGTSTVVVGAPSEGKKYTIHL